MNGPTARADQSACPFFLKNTSDACFVALGLKVEEENFFFLLQASKQASTASKTLLHHHLPPQLVCNAICCWAPLQLKRQFCAVSSMHEFCCDACLEGFSWLPACLPIWWWWSSSLMFTLAKWTQSLLFSPHGLSSFEEPRPDFYIIFFLFVRKPFQHNSIFFFSSMLAFLS